MKPFLKTTIGGNPVLIATSAIVAMAKQGDNATVITLNAPTPGFDTINNSTVVPLSFENIEKELADETEEFGDKSHLAYLPISGGGPSNDYRY